jgi:Tol biopolymer transport system component/DNA-binding winged helix-turn-helix (wHTH) protein
LPRSPKSSEPFELDPAGYELRRAGRRINLERLPMELLILLAENRGKLLTREQIVDHLWGKNAYLDTERNLNTAVGKIRRALGDDADQPRFVETVIGKGYRFTANGEFVLLRGPANPAPGAVADPPKPDSPPPDPRTVDTPEPVSSSRYRHRLGWLKLLTAVVVGVAGTVLWMNFRTKPVPWIRLYDRITNDGRDKAFKIDNIPLPILTDGSRLYFSVNAAAAGFRIGVVAAAGGETGVLATVPTPAALDVSADGSQLLLASPVGLPDGPLWMQPVPNGPPRRIANLMAQSASWSSDGKRILYTNRTGLLSAKTDGTDVSALVSVDSRAAKQIYWPRWSPDGTRLRYSEYEPKTGFHSLWEVSSGGGHPHPVLSGWNPAAHDCCGSWTPDGSYFVFASTRNGRTDIWAIPERSGLLGRKQGSPIQVTAGPFSFYAPLPAADGRLFVMGVEKRGELVRYDLKSKALLPWLAGISVTGVSVSRSGEWVAYTSYPDHVLWRSKVDGTQRLQLSNMPMEAYLPRWSPDESQIAFYARLPGKPYQVYVVPVGGGVLQPLKPAGEHQIDPNWSPDGTSLVFEREAWQQRGSHRPTALAVIHLKTGEISDLPGSTGLSSPRWSPDGRYIAAMPSDSKGLLLLQAKTGNWTELMQQRIGYPNWSRDGKYIYFDRFADPRGIARVRVSDGKVEDVLIPANRNELWAIDTWTGLAPDDSVLLLRDATVSDIYALKSNR